MGSRPVAKARSMRAIPATSAFAVFTMSTRLSGSSTQSTGTSWMRSPARAAAAGREQHPHLDAGQFGGHPLGDLEGAVGARVLGDGDAEGPRQPGEGGVQPAQARLEVGLLVVHGDDHVEGGRVTVEAPGT